MSAPRTKTPKAPTLALLAQGYTVMGNEWPANTVTVFRPATTDPAERPEHCAGESNSYTVAIGLDGYGALSAESCDCQGFHLSKSHRCRHARLVEAVALWVALLRTEKPELRKYRLGSCYGGWLDQSDGTRMEYIELLRDGAEGSTITYARLAGSGSVGVCTDSPAEARRWAMAGVMGCPRCGREQGDDRGECDGCQKRAGGRL